MEILRLRLFGVAWSRAALIVAVLPQAWTTPGTPCPTVSAPRRDGAAVHDEPGMQRFVRGHLGQHIAGVNNPCPPPHPCRPKMAPQYNAMGRAPFTGA